MSNEMNLPWIFALSDTTGEVVFIGNDGKRIVLDKETAAHIVKCVNAHDALVALLTRYRNETPLGHQPHMIAHEVDAALTAATKEKP